MDLYSALSLRTPNALYALLSHEQVRFSRRLTVLFERASYVSLQFYGLHCNSPDSSFAERSIRESQWLLRLFFRRRCFTLEITPRYAKQIFAARRIWHAVHSHSAMYVMARCVCLSQTGEHFLSKQKQIWLIFRWDTIGNPVSPKSNVYINKRTFP